MENMETTEKYFYKNSKNVIVTQSRFVAEGKTYAMRNISSVALFTKKKSRTMQILMMVIGVGLIFSPTNLRILGAIIAVLGAISMFLTHDEYSVRITTNAGETDGLVSIDKQYMQDVVNALSEAIVHRG